MQSFYRRVSYESYYCKLTTVSLIIYVCFLRLGASSGMEKESHSFSLLRAKSKLDSKQSKLNTSVMNSRNLLTAPTCSTHRNVATMRVPIEDLKIDCSSQYRNLDLLLKARNTIDFVRNVFPLLLPVYSNPRIMNYVPYSPVVSTM